MASKVFRKKKKFTKKYRIYNTKKDFAMQQEHKFALSSDPSKEILYGLLNVVTTTTEQLDEMSDDEIEELDKLFFQYVSEITVDCDIDGLDFSTPESTEDSFSDPEVDWHFLFSVYGYYVGSLLNTHKTLGKVLRQLADNENSGTDEEPQEKPSKKASGTESKKKSPKK